MNWIWKKFNKLTTEELYEIMQLRQRVFIIEQKCPYLDADGTDYKSMHLFAYSPFNSGRILSAYLRVVPAGIKYPEISIGRVVTAPEMRGQGLGKALTNEALKKIGAKPIRISAQAYLEKFYWEFGFEKVGEEYMEDWIPHIEMLKK